MNTTPDKTYFVPKGTYVKLVQDSVGINQLVLFAVTEVDCIFDTTDMIVKEHPVLIVPWGLEPSDQSIKYQTVYTFRTTNKEVIQIPLNVVEVRL